MSARELTKDERAVAAIKYRRFPKIIGTLYRFEESHPALGWVPGWVAHGIDLADLAQSRWRYRREVIS